MSTHAMLAGLLDAEDCLRSIPKELAALGQLMRLSAEHNDPLSTDEARGVCDLLHLVEIQARRLEEACDKVLVAPMPFGRPSGRP